MFKSVKNADHYIGGDDCHGSEPKSQGDRVEIIDFSPDLKDAIKKLNYEWLEKFFRLEPGDILSLSNPHEQIIDKGGFIFYARMNGEIVGTASLLKKNEEVFEIGKMAVTENAQGKGIGRLILEHCLKEAQKKSIKKLILYSNTKLQSAIQLYRKYGFMEVELEQGLYERADIKMEKLLSC